MPKQYLNQDYLVPYRGINTEANPLAFPEGFCLDALNVEAAYDPLRIQPRRGLKLTSGFINIDDYSTFGGEDAIVSEVWTGVGEDPNLDFLVMQFGYKLMFFEITNGNPMEYPRGTFDLDDYDVPTDAFDFSAAKQTVDMVPVKGALVVVGESIPPLLFTYDGTDISVTKINLKIRDVYGVDDGLYVSERPSTLTDEHKYNLENQGWYENLHTGGDVEQDPITYFNTEVGDYPSNADNISVGIVEGTDGDTGRRVFKPKYLKDFELGNSPTPKGHYIVDPFNVQRQGILDGTVSGDDKTGGNSDTGGLPDEPTSPRDPNNDYPWNPNYPLGNLP